MKKIIKNITRRQFLLGLSGILSFLVFAGFAAASGVLANSQDSQDMAERWSEDGGVAQVSCFFSDNAAVMEEDIQFFEHKLDQALVEASITQESPNAGARLWADAYSATGSVTIANSKSSVTVDAVGVGGDFFQFHPIYLRTGNYFSGSDVMQDHIIIDEETAWQLFGSNDVAGQLVTIGGVPHMIVGVASKETGRLAEAAGLDSAIVFVSYNTLLQYGGGSPIQQYEIVMPNPVKGYAEQYVRENIHVDIKEVDVLENTSRYGLVPLLKILSGFGTRSMNGKGIIYPYWENMARGYEDILALFMLAQALFLLYPVVLVIIALSIAWRHKTWTSASVYHTVQDKWERLGDKQRAKRREKHTGHNKRKRNEKGE